MRSDDEQKENFEAFRNGHLTPCYTYYHTSIALYVHSKGARAADVNDIVAETFAALWINRDQIGSASHLRNYLYMVARNKTISVFRMNTRYWAVLRKLEEEPSDAFSLEVDSLRNEVLTDVFLHLYIRKLPEREQKVIKMCLSEFTLREIAAQLGLPLSTAGGIKARAISKLRGWYQREQKKGDGNRK